MPKRDSKSFCRACCRDLQHHCWHTTHWMGNEDGVSRDEICCHCGKQRRTGPIKGELPTVKHGPHHPTKGDFT